MCQSCFFFVNSVATATWMENAFFNKATQIVVRNDVVGVVAIVMSSANYVPDANFSS